jgi:hypothetical protein
MEQVEIMDKSHKEVVANYEERISAMETLVGILFALAHIDYICQNLQDSPLFSRDYRKLPSYSITRIVSAKQH